jgi:hypothetical protein
VNHLIDAARVVDELFARQAWARNPEFAQEVAALQGPGADAVKDYYRIMVGPWDRLRSREIFVGNVPHPPGAGFYPEDLTKEAFEAWLTAHPEDKAAFTSPTTVIQREGDRLVAVPYSRAYADLLQRGAQALRAAAQAANTPSLKKFLASRADAFLSPTATTSPTTDWMDLDASSRSSSGPLRDLRRRLFGFQSGLRGLHLRRRFRGLGEPRQVQERAAVARAQAPHPGRPQSLSRGTGPPSASPTRS